MQMTIFSKGEVVTTQHLGLGTMKLRERLEKKSTNLKQYEAQIEELVDKELEVFKSLYMENVKIKYLIISGDYVTDMVRMIDKKQEEHTVETEKMLAFLKKFANRSLEEIEEELNLPYESDALLIPYMMQVSLTELPWIMRRKNSCLKLIMILTQMFCLQLKCFRNVI